MIQSVLLSTVLDEILKMTTIIFRFNSIQSQSASKLDHDAMIIDCSATALPYATAMSYTNDLPVISGHYLPY